MARNRSLQAIEILTAILLVPLLLYFKYFPTIIDSTITNLLVFLLVFAEILLFVCGAFMLRSQVDSLLLLPQMLIFVIIVRAIPNLRLLYPPLHDPYYHYVCTLNILDYGTLDPVLGWWYGGLNRQLHWPDMHLLTTALSNIANIDVMQLFRYQEPLMGAIFFLSVFILAEQVTDNHAVAVISSLFASLGDTVIFYQSEYHPQGLATVLFVFILYFLFKLNVGKKVAFRYLFLICCLSFSLSHYFTPLFIALIFIMYLVLSLTLRYLPLLVSEGSGIKSFLDGLTPGHQSDIYPVLIAALFALMYHIVFYDSAFSEFISAADANPVLSASLISLNQPEIPLITSILSSSKWGLFLLAAVSIAWVYWSKNRQELQLGMLLVCFIFAGAVGNYLVASPLDRIIAYYTPIAAIFAALTVFRVRDLWFMHRSKIGKSVAIVVFASLLMTAGVFNSQTPAYFFQDSEANTHYWYSNVLPKMEMYKPAGEWSGSYVPADSYIEVEFDTRVIPFYYGKRSVGMQIPLKDDNRRNFIMINPNVIYSGYEANKYDLVSKLNLIYSNPQIVIISAV